MKAPFLQTLQDYLSSFHNFEKNLNQIRLSDFRLERVRRLLSSLGNPQKNFHCLHVAGTKGKGSTCVFAAHMLEQAGFRVGLYTSPHLNDIRERIRILGKNVSPEFKRKQRASKSRDIFPDCITYAEFKNLVEDLKPRIEQFRNNRRWGRLTYFEVLTVCALWYFHKQKVDFAVLETGLGGRLDATSVVDPVVFGMTPISLDHVRLLGNTIERIAREKAAIIKSGSWDVRKTALIAPQALSVEKIIKNRCREQKVRPLFIGKDITFKSLSRYSSGQTFQIHAQKKYVLTTGLLGRHQAVNAAVAVGMIECLKDFGADIKARDIRSGVKKAFWPCRFEIMRKNPVVILDGAHNPKSCEELVNTVKDLFPGRKILLVLGVSEDKDFQGICSALNRIAQRVILTQSRHSRARDLSPLEADCLFPGKTCEKTGNVEQAIRFALKQAARQDLILITGSIFLAAEARNFLSS